MIYNSKDNQDNPNNVNNKKHSY